MRVISQVQAGNWTFWVRVAGQSLRRRLSKGKIMFAGTAFSVALLVFLQAFLNGVNDLVIHNAARFRDGHVAAWWQAKDVEELGALAQRLRSLPEIETVALRTMRQGILRHDGTALAPADLYGIDPASERNFSFVSGWMMGGRFDPGPGEIVLGHVVAGTLGVTAGDTVELLLSTGTSTSLRVIGILDASQWGDPYTAFTNFDPAPNDTLEVAILITSPDQADAVASRLKGILPESARIETWRGLLGRLMELVQISNAASVLTVALVALILAFGISSMTFVSVAERTREFGILKTIGITPLWIACLLLCETALLIGAAAVAGVLLGVGAVRVILLAGGVNMSGLFHYLPLFASGGPVMPRLTLPAMLLPLLAALFSGLVASLLPSLKAARISVVEALRTL